MKILFINISDIVGGAAIAARRLGKGLEKYHNTENFFVVRSKASSDKNVFPTRENGFVQVAEKWFNIFSNLLGIQYQYLPFSPKVILQKTREIKPDIISLHNTLGGYFTTSLIRELSKEAPIIWTLHDMWAFTGNSAHTFGDTSWKEMKNSRSNTRIYPAIGINTGSMLLKQKKKIYSESDITIVTPSDWLLGLAKESPVFAGKELHHIFNGIDLDIFKPRSGEELRKSLNIPPDARVIMFSAEKLNKNPYKGGRDLIEILKIINARTEKKVHLLILGIGRLEELELFNNFTVHTTGYVRDEAKVAEYLSMADLFVYPTRADNLSNALIESVASGTPAVTFDVGGCKEIIKNDVSGCLIEPFNLEKFAGETLRLLSSDEKLKELSHKSRKFAEENFSLKSMSESYYELFERKIRRK
ncbi:MAG TPA: glycosyltransferase [Ignavibacteriales bacterium]|nr:glycosyltransferase [Ignavibacteriales bacterium]